jgi:hypothetical protein
VLEMRCTILVEKNGNGFGARVSCLSEVVAVAPTKVGARKMALEAISSSGGTSSEWAGSLRKRPNQPAK